LLRIRIRLRDVSDFSHNVVQGMIVYDWTCSNKHLRCNIIRGIMTKAPGCYQSAGSLETHPTIARWTEVKLKLFHITSFFWTRSFSQKNSTFEEWLSIKYIIKKKWLAWEFQLQNTIYGFTLGKKYLGTLLSAPKNNHKT